MCRYPASSAARTASRVSSGGVWKTPRPSAGISRPLLRVTVSMVLLRFGLSGVLAVRLRWVSAVCVRGGRVFVVGDVLTPLGAVALLVNVEHRDVRHEAARCGAVPVVLTGLEEDSVAGTDGLDRAAAALTVADALGDEDRLTVGMGVPGRAGAWSEMHACRLHAVRRVWRGHGVHVDGTRKPVAGARCGLDGVLRHFHSCLSEWSRPAQSDWPVGRIRISFSETLRGRESANAMTSAMSWAEIDSLSYICSAVCLVWGWVMWSVSSVATAPGSISTTRI